MGNCQAIDNATIVIQHPSGRADKLYWPVTASDIMKSNPGHCVALLLTTTTTAFCPPPPAAAAGGHQDKRNTVRVTRIKLLRPKDMLILGQVYRLVTKQEVMKGLSAKKFAKMKKNQELGNSNSGPAPTKSVTEKCEQVQEVEKHRPRTTKTSNSSSAAKSKSWQPSLKSISESIS